MSSSQAKGTNSTSFLLKERSGVSTLDLKNEVELVPLTCEDGDMFA